MLSDLLFEVPDKIILDDLGGGDHVDQRLLSLLNNNSWGGRAVTPQQLRSSGRPIILRLSSLTESQAGLED